MAYNTTATLDKLSCNDYVDFGKCQRKFGRFSWTKNYFNYLDIKLKVIKREVKNAKFRLRRNFTMGEVDFNQFFRQRDQLFVAADNFLRDQNLSPILEYSLSGDMEEQLKLVHRWLTLCIAQIEGFVWHCCDTRRTTQRPPMLKFVYSDGRRRKKSFSKLCMSTINLTNLYIFLTSWVHCMTK